MQEGGNPMNERIMITMRQLGCGALVAAAVAVFAPGRGGAQVNLDDMGVKDKAQAVKDAGGGTADAPAAAEQAPAAAGEGAGAKVPADDTMGRLQGAAGVGVSKTAEDAAKGGGAAGAAKKGGAAAVQDYMKGGQGAAAGAQGAAGAPPAGDAAPMKGKGAGSGEAAPQEDEPAE